MCVALASEQMESKVQRLRRLSRQSRGSRKPMAADLRAPPTPGEPLRMGPALVFAPAECCTAAVVWLHGFGDDPGGWAEALQPLRGAHTSWKWVHLRAPPVPQTFLRGARLPGWGDFLEERCVGVGSADHESADASGHYAATAAAVHATVEALQREDGLAPERIVVGGFSQGAACALDSALSFSGRLAGCVALSGWLLPSARRALAAGTPNREMPLLICHGTADPQVGFDCAEFAKRMLGEAGATVQFKAFRGMEHECCEQEEEILAQFLASVLPQRGSS